MGPIWVVTYDLRQYTMHNSGISQEHFEPHVVCVRGLGDAMTGTAESVMNIVEGHLHEERYIFSARV